MRTIKVYVYKVHELSEDAKQRAFVRWLETDASDYGWSEENQKSLEAFADVFPISIRHWEYDQWRGHVDFDFEEEPEIADLSGIRLMKYIYNNYWDSITKGRYYSLWSKKDQNPHYREGGHAPWGELKSRYSKVLLIPPMTGACPFTGYYMDEEILDPVFQFLKNPSEDVTFYDLMQECVNAWIKACIQDYNTCTSMDYFLEVAEANGFEFYEDGSMA